MEYLYIYVYICCDLHTITRLSSGCRNLHSECKATYILGDLGQGSTR